MNIEYPGERGIRNAIDAFFNGYGIEYEAYAKVLGDARDIDDYEGEYECYAWVPNDEDHEPRETWAGYVKRKVKAEDSISLAENDEEWAAADKARYGSWADIQADTDLSQCTAWGDINGASPEKNWQEWIKVDPINPDIAPKPWDPSYYDPYPKWVLVDKYRPALSNKAYANAWNFPDPTEHNKAHEGDAD